MLRSRALIIAAICTLVACVVHLAYGPTRADFRELIIAFTVAFVAYLFIVRNGSISWSHLLTLAIGLRIALLFAQVTWTDDHYRYIWDGLCPGLYKMVTNVRKTNVHQNRVPVGYLNDSCP